MKKVERNNKRKGKIAAARSFNPCELKFIHICIMGSITSKLVTCMGIKMDIQTIMKYFLDYGAIAVFVIVLLEYMNLPGFPAGIIMPLAGVWASKGGISFFLTIVISVAAGVLGSWILYFLGRAGGELLLKKYLKKFPKQEAAINKNLEMIREKGYFGIFISKLIPMVRTIISIPAGVMKMNFLKYTISSALGVFVWNLVLIGAGYYMGDAVFQLFS